MEELAPQTYCQRAALELAALIRHQRKPVGKVRRDSALLRRCVEEVLAAVTSRMEGVQQGPWSVGTKPLKRPGRGGLKFIPFAQRGGTTVLCSTSQEAEDLVAFLNYCGITELGH